MRNTRNQTCALGSSLETAPRAATSGHYFKMTTGALSPAAKAANSQKQQQRNNKYRSELLFKREFWNFRTDEMLMQGLRLIASNRICLRREKLSVAHLMEKENFCRF